MTEKIKIDDEQESKGARERNEENNEKGDLYQSICSIFVQNN